jgi:peptide/nickel transport system substrate-binding protein
MVSQIGTWSYRSIKPYTGAVKKESSNTGLYLGIAGGVVLVLLVAGVIVATRRRTTADDRE